MTRPCWTGKRFRTERYARRYAWGQEADQQQRGVPVQCQSCGSWGLAVPGHHAHEGRRPMINIYRDPTPVAHGYTVAHAARLAYTGAQSASRWPGVDRDDRHAIALCAVVAELRACDADPGALHLIRAAQQAVTRECARDMSSRGRNANPWRYDRAYQAGFPRYATPGASTPLAEAVAERVACRQILAVLTDRQREVLHALAACDGDPKAAAPLLGVLPTTVSAILRNARDRFLPLWHEHETPPAIDWRRGRTNTYSPEAAAARAEIARRSAQTRKQRPTGTETTP